MTSPPSNSTTDQTNDDETDIDTAINHKRTEIHALLPGLQRIIDAFGELRGLVDGTELAENFDASCQSEFGVVPELLLDATESLSLPRNRDDIEPQA